MSDTQIHPIGLGVSEADAVRSMITCARLESGSDLPTALGLILLSYLSLLKHAADDETYDDLEGFIHRVLPKFITEVDESFLKLVFKENYIARG